MENKLRGYEPLLFLGSLDLSGLKHIIDFPEMVCDNMGIKERS